jgi:hypothetical protein
MSAPSAALPHAERETESESTRKILKKGFDTFFDDPKKLSTVFFTCFPVRLVFDTNSIT